MNRVHMSLLSLAELSPILPLIQVRLNSCQYGETDFLKVGEANDGHLRCFFLTNHLNDEPAHFVLGYDPVIVTVEFCEEPEEIILAELTLSHRAENILEEITRLLFIEISAVVFIEFDPNFIYHLINDCLVFRSRLFLLW